MPTLKVGLAPNKTSFYDPKTNTYITLENPVQTINYTTKTDLSGICHACNSLIPSLVLYEGKFPKATLDAWKAKYDLAGKQAKERADEVQSKSRDNKKEEEKEEEVEDEEKEDEKEDEEEVEEEETEEPETPNETQKKKK